MKAYQIEPAKLLDGKKISCDILRSIQQTISEKKVKATLVVILVGDNPASLSYINIKRRMCKKAGIDFVLKHFQKDAFEEEIIATIQQCNQDKAVTGIVVQLPLPAHVNTKRVINTVAHTKDVDGLADGSFFVPCAVGGIMSLLEYGHVSLEKKRVVVVGNGMLVGKPLTKLLREKNIDYVVCDRQTKDLSGQTRKGDIVISATGSPFIINADSIKPGSVVVDAGTVSYQGKIVGDVDLNSVSEKVAKIAPVPGGVGPMTVVMLMKNVLRAYDLRHGCCL